MGSKKLKGTVADSLLLAIVRILTIVVGLLSTMILSRKLSLAVYGTYTQGTTIISIGTSFSILGLTDSVNFFYNSKTGSQQKAYVNT
jgi:O-antigen/teichoic acid export membrane protein